MFKLIIVERAPIRDGPEIAVDYSALGIQVVGTAQSWAELIPKTKATYCADRYHHAHYGCFYDV